MGLLKIASMLRNARQLERDEIIKELEDRKTWGLERYQKAAQYGLDAAIDVVKARVTK
jgi:hypothetical protein